MSEIVNLKRVRKDKAKKEKDAKAAANRAAFGTPKALRKLSEARKEKAAHEIEGHRLEAPEEN